jgi:UV DNA damage endonuclease
MRLGFVAKSLTHPELKSHDSRRWQNSPHLSVSLAYLRDMLAYVARARIRMYRMSSDLAPYATHPDMPQFHNQIDECAIELAAIGELASRHDIRLSFHPAQHVLLNSPDPRLVQHGLADLASQAAILDAMHLGSEAVVVVHLGGLYGDRCVSRQRFVDNVAALPGHARRRLVLENDDTRYGVADTLWVHERTGLRLVFDALHHRLNNLDGRTAHSALAACLATWPASETPKVHFSSPRTELVIERQPGSSAPQIRRPQWRNHADYVNPFEFVEFLHDANGLRDFDVMLEVKAKDIALLQLRRDVARFAPDLAGRTGVQAEEATAGDECPGREPEDDVSDD